MESPTDTSSARKFRCSLPHFFSGKKQKRDTRYNKRILDLIIYQTGEKFGLDCEQFVLYVLNKKLTHMFTLAREVRIQWKPALRTPANYAHPYTFNGQFLLT